MRFNLGECTSPIFMHTVNMLMRGYANSHLQSCPHGDTCLSVLILAVSVLIGAAPSGHSYQ